MGFSPNEKKLTHNKENNFLNAMHANRLKGNVFCVLRGSLLLAALPREGFFKSIRLL